MARSLFRLGTALALAATATMAATPAMARDYRWNRHHHRGIDAGDVLAGVLIIGGIAAIASAASKADRDRREREYRDYRYRDAQPDYRGEYPPRAPATRSGSGIDNAVNICMDQVERGEEQVGSVDNASRTADGWRISGQLASGAAFSCWIDNSGRIRNVDIGDDYYGASYDGAAQGQWSDDAYIRARALSQGGSPYAPADEADYPYADYNEIDGDLASTGY